MRFDRRAASVRSSGDDDRAVLRPGGPRDGAAVEGLEALRDGCGHGLAEGSAGGDQDRLRAFVVLGLGQQVERDPVGVVVGVGDDEDLGRAGDHVDADAAEDPALGGGDEGVAGAGDLVDRGDGFGAVGQRRNRLRAADAIDRVDAGDLGGQQDQRVHLPVRGRAGDDQPLDPGDTGGDRVHQDRGRVGGGAARHIEARGRYRRPAPAKRRPGAVGPAFVLRLLAFVVGADAVGGEFQRGAVLGRDAWRSRQSISAA